MKKLILGASASLLLLTTACEDDAGGGTTTTGGTTAFPTTTTGDAGLTTTGGDAAATNGITGATSGITGVVTGITGVDGGTTGTDGGTTTGVDGGTTSVNGGTTGTLPELPSGEDYDGWTWVETPGAICRDGSPAGYYHRQGSSKNVYIFLNGGGACADPTFCALNPENVNEDLPYERLIDATFVLFAQSPDQNRQVPPDMGMFKQDDRNPLKDWSGIYVPYCTGDVHAGTRTNVTVPNVDGTHNFVGYNNLGLFLEEFGPHFADSEQVLLTGSSAGSFGALFNFDRVQTFFDQWGIDVSVIADSGIPMRDQVSDADVSENPVDYMAPCLQATWRELWGLNDAMPADCTACKGNAGGISQALGDFLFRDKYKDRFLGGFVSSVEDNVMRGFFGAGGNPTDPASNCDTTDETLNVIGEAVLTSNFPPQLYHYGLRDAVDNLAGRDRVAYYVMPGDKHMHLWRDRYYENQGLGQTIAEWVADVIAKKNTHTGDLDQGL